MFKFLIKARPFSIVGCLLQKMTHKYTNRLALEKSPYLLQHAHNPVDWYPWNHDSLMKAKNENKVIFLSVGYSTCHWCHVMEHETFENEEIAKVMNANFVNIKVDREERPDVDRIYMTFVQATSGSGGWPMSVWLTPDLEPIMAGTYFPPEDTAYGEPGFLTIAKNIAYQWRDNPSVVKEQASRIVEMLNKNLTLKMPKMINASPQGFIDLCYSKMAGTYDHEYGGFGHAPKFPMPVNFNFLFRLYHIKHAKKREALEMALHTLRMMAKGGIRDHVGLGFHRYSTDRQWHVPHFEKMLYDQAQLTISYLEAYQISKDPIFAEVAKEILEYVGRDLTHSSGGIFSAEDADSLPSHDAPAKKEGAFCVWTYQEIQELLVGNVDSAPHLKVADVFAYHYGIKPNGNVNPVHDPRNELKNKNVLVVKGTEDATADHFKISWSEVHKIMTECRRILYWERQKRPKPQLDDKMIAAWNGLMISAYAKAYQIFKEESYKNRALEAANFIRRHLYSETNKRLVRTAYTSKTDESVLQLPSPIPGSLDDYAFVIRGLLDLYEAVFQPWCLEWAMDLQQSQDNLLWDRQNKGYFTTDPSDSHLIIKLKEDQDGAEPSGSSVSASNLVRLAYLTNQLHMKSQATELLALYQSRLDHVPHAFPEMVVSALWTRTPPVQIMVIGDLGKETTRSFIATINSFFLPFKVLLLGDPDDQNFVYKNFELLRSLRRSAKDDPIVFICEQFTCKPAITSVHQLELELSKLGT